MRKGPQPAEHSMRCGGIRYRHTPSAWARNKAQGVPADIVRFVIVVVAVLLLCSLW